MGGAINSDFNIRNLFFILALFLLCFGAAFIMATQSTFWAMAAVVGTAFFALGFLNPQLALYVVIFSMLLSPEIGKRDLSGSGFTIRLEDIMLVVMGFAWLTTSALKKDVGLAVKTELNRPIFFYVFACVISTSYGIMIGNVESPFTGIMFVLKYMEYFVVFFMTLNLTNSRTNIKTLVAALMITYVIVIIIGFAQIPGGGRISAPFEGEDAEPNTLGGYLMLLLSLNITVFFHMKTRKTKIALAFMAFLAFVAILYTLSRSSWLSLFVMYIFQIFYTKGHRKKLIAILLAGLMFAPFTMPDEVVERALYTFQKKPGEALFSEAEAQYIREVYNVDVDSSTAARLGSMKSALRDFGKHPVLGYGVTGYMFLDAQYHRVLIETGSIGMAAFLLLLFTTGRLLYRNMKNYTEDPLYSALTKGTFCAFMGLLVHAIGTNTFIIVRIMEPFWCLVALNLAIPIVEENERIEAEFLAAGKKPKWLR